MAFFLNVSVIKYCDRLTKCLSLQRDKNKMTQNMGKTYKNEHFVHFTKMHGAGNDYIYVNTLIYDIDCPEEFSRRWSAAHTGIGSDGLVLICKPTEGVDADFRMRIFNADGSEAMMCGNASRCIGKYVYEKGLTRSTEVKLETLSGIKVLRLHLDSRGKAESVTVDMGEPCLHQAEQYDESVGGKVSADGREFDGTFVSMGNPHFVIFVNDIINIDISCYGKVLERDPAFPQRCNIEFAQVTARGKIRTRVWERGSGITMACGTGACATAVAAAFTGRGDRHSTICMDGGDLDIEWGEDNHVYMTGPAEFAFEGDISLD